MLMLAALLGNLIQHKLVWSTEAADAEVFEGVAARRAQAAVFQAGDRQFRQGSGQADADRRRADRDHVPERDRFEGLSAPIRWRLLPFTQTLALKMLGAVVAILAVVAAADYFFQYRQWFEKQKMSLQRPQGRVQADRRRSDHQGQAAADAPAAFAQAHDGEGAEGGGHHHQPDPLRRRLAIRARHGGADLRRQGRRRHRAQDQGSRRASIRSRSSRTRRSPARCTPPSTSTRRFRPSIIRRSPRSSAMS